MPPNDFRPKLWGLALLWLWTMDVSPVAAHVQKDLATFFQKLGAQSNDTSAGVYRDQAAGYYNGGRLFARNRVHQAQLGHVDLPSFRAGCGGIDWHLGAFSYISSEKLVQMLRSIGSSVASYALMLALETMSPQVKNIISELNDLAQKINTAQINSCKIAATALGAALPRSEAAQHHLCTMIGTEGAYGGFSDYAAANQGCGAGGRRGEVLAAGRQLPAFAKVLGTQFNVAWKALQENAFLQGNRKLAEFFMTLSGTLISKDQGGRPHLTSKASLAHHEGLLGALLYGGQAPVYACQDEDCLTVHQRTLLISPQEALVHQVGTLLQSMQHKILQDQPLSAQEKSFLASTKLPFYRLLNVLTAYRRGEAPMEISDYAELAAMDVLDHYVTQILDVMEESLGHLRQAQVDDTALQTFERGLRAAKQRVHQRRMGDLHTLERVHALVQKTQMLEKTLMGRLGVLASGGAP